MKETAPPLSLTTRRVLLGGLRDEPDRVREAGRAPDVEAGVELESACPRGLPPPTTVPSWRLAG